MLQNKRESIFNLRLEPGLKTRLAAAAKAEGRTITNLLNYIVKKFLEELRK